MNPLVHLIDDDVPLLRALSRTVQSAGYAVAGYRSAKEFLAAYSSGQPGCVVLDVTMPDMSGEELHMCLKRKGQCPPVIFMSGNDDIPTAVRAMKNGALDFLTKPLESGRLIEAISHAIDILSEVTSGRNAANDRLYALSPRELEIFAHVVRGELCREIAHELAISLRTVKAHRATIGRKLGTRSVAEWTRVAARTDFSIMPITPTTLCGRGGDRRRRA